MKKYNFILTGLIVLFGIFVLILSKDFPEGFRGSGLGPGFFPIVIVVIMLVLAGLNLLEAFRMKDKSISFSLSTIRLPLFLISSVVVYTALFSVLGFILDSLIFLFASMTFLKVKWLKALIVAVAVTLVLYLIFRTILRIPLPRGILGV